MDINKHFWCKAECTARKQFDNALAYQVGLFEVFVAVAFDTAFPPIAFGRMVSANKPSHIFE